MSCPNLAGSLNLLVHHYEDTHGSTTPLSSTMKAILIQTADEAGANDGPDYVFGWGLMNTLTAADLISEDAASPFLVHEAYLADGDIDTLYLESDGVDPLRVTLVWTDPKGTPPSPSLNPTTLMLVNDLDVRVVHVATTATHLPYVLDPSNPADAATTADNVRDNVEQVHVTLPASGLYMVTVSHKGTLSANQWYSLVSSLPLTTTADATPPSVTVTDPNGGETLFATTQFEITWTATDANGVDSVDILCSYNNGADFDTVSLGEDNDGSYMWTVPGTLSTQCLVRIVAFDPFLNTGQDDSDAVFEIKAPPQVSALGIEGQLLLAVLLVGLAVVLILRVRRRARERV
jgi:hypothetical protein